LLIGLTINLVSALWLFSMNAAAGRPRVWRALALAAWLGVAALSLTHPQRHLPGQIEEWRAILSTGQRNVQTYLATGDPSFVDRKPAVEVPSFDAPEIRAALPPELTGHAPPHPWLEAVKEIVVRLGFFWLGLGVALIIAVVAARAAARSARPSA